jgi:hypothetical protein
MIRKTLLQPVQFVRESVMSTAQSVTRATLELPVTSVEKYRILMDINGLVK